ncbi:MAG: ArsR/SmtB family transcription factor [Solirubrobacterales bacterium]
MADKRDGRIDQELVKALSHPIRIEILEALQGRVASPTELSQEMDESLGVISYHAKTLVKCGCLELVHTEPRRGAIEHFFGLAPRSSIGHQDWRRAPLAVREKITAAALGTFIETAAKALEDGTIDRRDETVLTWMPLTVDETGWREIATIMEKAARLVAEAQERSRERLEGADGLSIVVGLAAFETGKRRAPDDKHS